MEKFIDIHYFTAPVGELILGSYEEQLCLCDWRYRKMRAAIDKRTQQALKAGYKEGSSAVIIKTIQQLNEYFDGKRTFFDIPLLLIGTDFQKRVWNLLLSIPYGNTISYLKLSEQIGNPLAIRSVASANGANSISIIIPCHRIIGSNRELVGYAGGLDAKKKLLALESPSSCTQTLLF